MDGCSKLVTQEHLTHHPGTQQSQALSIVVFAAVHCCVCKLHTAANIAVMFSTLALL